MGVQCCKKQDIDQHLKERENIRVDPFGSKSMCECNIIISYKLTKLVLI